MVIEKLVQPDDGYEYTEDDSVIYKGFYVYENDTGEEVISIDIKSFCKNKKHTTFHELTDKPFSVKLEPVSPKRASIHIGGRTYSETIDLVEEKEYFDEAEFIHPRYKPTWEYYTRPIKVVGWNGLSEIKGTHLLFGWVEGICQSDRSPMFCLEEGQDRKVEIGFEFS